MDIFLHRGRYQGDTDDQYNNNHQYKIWIKQDGEKIMVKQHHDHIPHKNSRRDYNNLNEFMDNWGMINKDPLNTKLIKK